jgi:hypothetical protein
VAKNTGKGYRKGEVKDRSQVETPVGWVKRDTNTGRFLDVKSDGEPFKGVRREHPEEQEQIEPGRGCFHHPRPGLRNPEPIPRSVRTGLKFGTPSSREASMLR